MVYFFINQIAVSQIVTKMNGHAGLCEQNLSLWQLHVFNIFS